MIDWVRGCLARVGCLTLLVVGVAAGWVYHDDLAAWWLERAPAPAVAEPSEEMARRAERRVTRVLGSEEGGEVRLGAAELQSLVRYRLGPGLPAGVTRPAVRLRDPSVEVAASLDLARLAGDELPAAVGGMLGDTTRVTALLRPAVPVPGRLHLRVEELRAGAIGVPSVVMPVLLRELPVPVSENDARTLALDVGLGLTSVRVERDSLVLTRRAGE